MRGGRSGSGDRGGRDDFFRGGLSWDRLGMGRGESQSESDLGLGLGQPTLRRVDHLDGVGLDWRRPGLRCELDPASRRAQM